MNTEELILLHLVGNATGGATDDVVAPPVPYNAEDTIEHLAIENQTTSCIKARLLVDASGIQHDHIEISGVSAGILYHTDERILIPSAHRWRVRFYGATADDALVVNAIVRRRWITPPGQRK